MQSPMLSRRLLPTCVGLTILMLVAAIHADDHDDHSSMIVERSGGNTTNGPMKCYQCNSHYPNQSQCQNNEMNALQSFLKPCQLNTDGVEALGCWKQTFLIPYNQQGDAAEKVARIIRACAYSKPDKPDDCAQQSEFGTTSNQCFCRDSSCNHASKIDNTNLFSILTSLLVTVALSMLFK